MPAVTTTAFVASDADCDKDILDHLATAAKTLAAGSMKPGTRVRIVVDGSYSPHIVRGLGVVLHHDQAKGLVDVLALTPAGAVLPWKLPAEAVSPAT